MMSKQNTPPLLTKPQSSYKKLEKAMNEPVKEYNAIKSLVENNENSIEKIGNITQLKNVKLLPHQKKK